MSVDMDVAGVMVAYLPVVCVCELHSASLQCAVHSKYAAITPTTSISTDMIEPLL